MVDNVRQGTSVQKSVAASIITDRAVYKAGDTIYVKVCARTPEGSELVVPVSEYQLDLELRGPFPAPDFEWSVT